MHMRAHTHISMRTHTHARTQADEHTYMHACALPQASIHTHPHTLAHTCARCFESRKGSIDRTAGHGQFVRTLSLTVEKVLVTRACVQARACAATCKFRA
eukprot:6213160-Pleurochrysis_carterae.AAC.1